MENYVPFNLIVTGCTWWEVFVRNILKGGISKSTEMKGPVAIALYRNWPKRNPCYSPLWSLSRGAWQWAHAMVETQGWLGPQGPDRIFTQFEWRLSHHCLIPWCSPWCTCPLYPKRLYKALRRKGSTFLSSFLFSFPLLSFSWLGWKCEVTHKRKQEEIGLVLQMLFLGRTGKRVYEELVSQEWIFEGKVWHMKHLQGRKSANMWEASKRWDLCIISCSVAIIMPIFFLGTVNFIDGAWPGRAP